MKYFKNRFFLIALLLAIVLAVVPTVLSLMGHGGLVRGALGVVATPFRWCADRCTDAVRGFAAYFTEYDRMKEENATLRDLLRSYEGQLDEAAVLAEENAHLREYLKIREKRPDFTFVDAEVIGRESGNHSTLYVINRGSAHGVEVGMPVMVADGLVGHIREVGLTSSKVVILTESTSAVGAIVSRSAERGVLEGSFELWASGLCRLSYLRENADIREGDVILTAGGGSFYPYGLKVGRVVDVRLNEADRTLVATVKPEVDLSALTRVMVLTDFSFASEDPVYDEVFDPSQAAG